MYVEGGERGGGEFDVALDFSKFIAKNKKGLLRALYVHIICGR